MQYQKVSLDLKDLNFFYKSHFQDDIFDDKSQWNEKHYWLLDYILRYIFPKREGRMRLLNNFFITTPLNICQFQNIKRIFKIGCKNEEIFITFQAVWLSYDYYVYLSDHFSRCEPIYSNEHSIIAIYNTKEALLHYCESIISDEDDWIVTKDFYEFKYANQDVRRMLGLRISAYDTDKDRKEMVVKLFNFWSNQSSKRRRIEFHHNGEIYYHTNKNEIEIQRINEMIGDFISNSMNFESVENFNIICSKNDNDIYMIGKYHALRDVFIYFICSVWRSIDLMYIDMILDTDLTSFIRNGFSVKSRDNNNIRDGQRLKMTEKLLDEEMAIAGAMKWEKLKE